jgi:hypothetical protein
MVMTKTELQKQRVKAVLEFLTEQFDAQIDDNGDGGRLDITIGEFNGQIMRRDLQVAFWDAIRLVGQFTPSKWQHHLKAVEFEKQINDEINKVLATLN